MPVPEIFVDLDSVVFIQEDGPCTGYLPMPCHAIDSTSIGRTEATRVYCKSPSRRGERTVARTVVGRKEAGTLTINAWSQEQSDLLHRLWQKNCMFGAQTHLDVCGLPTDPTVYKKILDYYGIVPGSLDYSNIDNLEGGEGTGLQVALSCTYDDLVEVLKIALHRCSRDVAVPGGITDVGDTTGIAVDLTSRCSPDACGAPRDLCDTIVIYVAMAPPTCWYSTDNGILWTTTAVLPLAATALVNAIRASWIIGDRWIGHAVGLTAGYGGLCAYTEDSGGTWTLIDMGGTAGADYVYSGYLHDPNNLWACGGDAGPSGHVWFSDDQGDSWTMFEDVNTQILRDIATADGNTIYAVGEINTIIKSENAGASWTALTGPMTGAFDLHAVRALTNDHVLVGGEIDTNLEQLWCSLDGGTTWTAQIFDGSTTASSRVHTLDLAPNAPKQHVWMTQGITTLTTVNYVFRSLDGGHDWERWDRDNDGLIFIRACDSNHAFVGGYGDAAEGGTATVLRAIPVG